MLNQELYEHISPMMNHAYMQKKWFEWQFKPMCKEHGIKYSEFSILLALHLNPEIKTAVDIEKFSELKRGNISICVDILCHKGFLKQVTSENDRRFKTLVLTEKANEILEKGDEIINEYCTHIFQGIPQEDFCTCNKVFTKMTENLQVLYQKKLEEK